MHRVLYFLWVSLFIFNTTQAQNQQLVDSLLQVLNTDIALKGKVTTYLEIAEEYQNTDSSNTVKYANEAISLSNNINYHKGIINAHYTIAWVTMQFGNYNKAEYLLNNVLIESKAIDYKIGKVKAWSGLGLINYKQNIYDKALSYYFKSLSIAEELGDKEVVMSNYHYIGNIYIDKAQYGKALDYHFKSLAIRKELKNKKDIAYGYSNIGIIYDLRGEYDKALEYYIQALDIRKETGDTYGVGSDYNNLGMLYKSMEDYEQALVYAFKSLDIFKETGNKMFYSYPILTIGEIYLAQKKWKSAKKYYEEGLLISKESGNKLNIKLAAKDLAFIERELGDFEKAYEYHVLYKQIEDSLKSKQQIQKITQLEMNYKFQQEKDSLEYVSNTERVMLENDIEKWKFIQLVTSLGLLLLGAVIITLYLFYRSNRNKNRLLKKKSDELEKVNFEISLQKEEIEILNDALENHLSETTKDLLTKNEKLVEYAYYNSHETRAPLARLLGLIQIIDFADSEEEKSFILEKIKENSIELDYIINKMNHILKDTEVFKK